MKISQISFLALLVAANTCLGGRLAEEQVQWYNNYLDQKARPKVEDMLVNADPEPGLTDGFVDLYDGKSLGPD